MNDAEIIKDLKQEVAMLREENNILSCYLDEFSSIKLLASEH